MKLVRTADHYQLEFTEKMRGWFGFGESDSGKGFEQGQLSDSAMMFRLTISVNDLYSFIEDPQHLADARGWVRSEVLGGRLPVESGKFNLFVSVGVQHKHMRYRLFFSDGAGRPLTLSGFKDLRHNRFTHLWRETSTLYFRILAGHIDAEDEQGGAAQLVGSGILHILPL